MEDGQNIDPICIYNHVDDPVASVNHLTDSTIPNLRDYAARKGEIFQAVRRFQQPVFGHLGVSGGLSGQELPYVTEVGAGLAGPPYFRHARASASISD